MNGHDDNCGGCETLRRINAAKGRGIAITACLGYCDKCEYSGNSAYFHRVNGKRLCSTCADVEVSITTKVNALDAYREACQ